MRYLPRRVLEEALKHAFEEGQTDQHDRNRIRIKKRIIKEPEFPKCLIYIKMIVVGIVLLVVQTLSAAPSVTNMTDYYAQKLNRTRLDYEAFSGYEPIDWYFDNGNIFYTYWGYNNGSMNSTDTKLIVFLQGGPGASGQFSAFNYIGPLRVVRNSNDSSKMHLESNIHGWNSIGNLLVVDQPFGVGFSYEQNNKIVSSTEEAANYFVNFMYNFKKTWNITTQ